MSYTLFIDESGSINLNNNERYFVIGGYLIETGNLKHNNKMIKIIKNVNKKEDEYFNYRAKIQNNREVKFSNLNTKGKDFVYNSLSDLDGTYVAIVVDKHTCTKITKHRYNDYYNYLVGLLINYIFNVRKFADIKCFKELKIIFDNRSMKLEANNDLQAYLIKELKFNKKKKEKFICNFNIRAADSKVNRGVMISDFIAGIVWARCNYGDQDYGDSISVDYLSKFPYKTFGQNILQEKEEKVLTKI